MTTEAERYNGWTNYSTWNVALWLGNEQGSQEYWAEQAQEAWDRAEASSYNTREESACYALGQQMKDDIAVENQPDLGASMYADLLGAALSEVDWDEIASHYIEEVEKEAEEAETDA